MKGNKQRTPFHEEFSAKIIKMLEEGTAPWQKPWTPDQNLVPRNPLSGTIYRGINRLSLAMTGADDPRWMTLKQANDAGYRIKKGSHGCPVVYYQFTRERDKLDENGQPVLKEDGTPEKETVRLDRPIMRMSTVFNARHVEGFPPLEKGEVTRAWEPQERAEKILRDSGAVIKHDQLDRAFYAPSSDEIHLPPQTSFDQADKYYATALHELGHWTGHPSRMDRAFGPRGTEAYACEELRAEIASWMLGQEIGVGHDPGQHAAYVQSWIEVIKNDSTEILRACRDAEAIKEYVLGLEKEKTQEVEQDQPTAPAGGAKPVERVAAMDTPASSTPAADPALAKTWLYVAYKDKDAAKALGAKWDRDQRQWYAPEGTDLNPLRQYISPPKKEVEPTLSPQEEFAQALADLGLDLQGKLPELDGQIHRVPVLGKDGRGRDGAYCLHGDGRPAGWAQNHVTGEKQKLVASGTRLSPAEVARQREQQAARRQAALEERQKAQNLVAEKSRQAWDRLGPSVPDNIPYLQEKGVKPFGIKADGHYLIVPARNIEGEMRGFQSIGPGGQKSFLPGMEKSGNFHLIGSDDGKDLSSGEIILCEGYATGASIHMATGKPVAVAFDAGNLVPVAEKIRAKYPNAAITICADNDHATQRDGKPYNIGVEKAKEAAQKVQGKVRVPIFNREERSRGLTDFNDLHKSRGLKAVGQQLGSREIER